MNFPKTYNEEKKMFHHLIEEYEEFFNYVQFGTDFIKTDLSSLLYPIFIHICRNFIHENNKTEYDLALFNNFLKKKTVFFINDHTKELLMFIETLTKSLNPTLMQSRHNILSDSYQQEIDETTKQCIDYFCKERELSYLRNIIVEIGFDDTSKLSDASHLPKNINTGYKVEELNQKKSVSFNPNSVFISTLEENANDVNDLKRVFNALTYAVACFPSYVTVQTVDLAGQNLFVGTYRGTCKWYNLKTKEIINLYGHVGPITAIEVSKDGRHMATASYDNRLIIWKFENNNFIILREITFETPILSIEFTEDHHLICSNLNCFIYIYDLEEWNEIAVTNTLFATPEIVKAHPSGLSRYLFVATTTNTIKCYKFDESNSINTFVQSFVLPENVGVITSMEIAPNGLILAVGTSFGYMIIFNLETKEIDFNLQIFDKHHVTSISFNSLTNVIALGSTNSLVKSFKIVTGKKNSFEPLIQIPTKNLTITCLKFLANDTLGIVAKTNDVTHLENSNQFKVVDENTTDIEQ
eukprot:TRINITY_DN3236_c1_g4_i1.p1 TRINITY_DN3236_c1_g4~~TRINITY_DN3236_c1_g4_i1.p1  ORF type:complete len:525 (+),score=110.83 TRINITY_DN3236_c1_g4_i1:48-1622(+)